MTSNQGTDRRIDPRPIVAFGLVFVWSVILNVLSSYTWTHGVLTFFMLLSLVLLVVGARALNRALPQGGVRPSAVTNVLSVVAAVLTLWFLVTQFWGFQNLAGKPLKTDIADNTYAAEMFTFDLQMNPYKSPTQTGHRVEGAPNVTREAGQLEMFGIPYYYGYPYYPGMFLSYEPFRKFDNTEESIRTGNAVIYALLLASMAWLAASLAPSGYKILSALLTLMSFVVTLGLWNELFGNGVTDFVIALFAVAGFLALRYDQKVVAGAFFGWAFACKLVPGSIFVLILILWYWRKPGGWKFLAAMAATFLLAVLPYFLKDPAAFMSATLLFYLTEHARGDNTAMWFHLPKIIQPIFQVIGYAAVAAIIFVGGLRKGLGLPGAMAICFIASALFDAFSRMTHLNYLWAFAPLGSLALVALVLGEQPKGESEKDRPRILEETDLSPALASG